MNLQTNGLDLKTLNRCFKEKAPKERLEMLYHLFPVNEVLFTSSFGTQSAALLHLVNSVAPRQSVHFIDTGYHFQETLDYKLKLQKELDLNVIDVKSDSEEHQYTKGKQLWKTHPDFCCKINKVNPLHTILPDFKVWVSGLLGFQTAFRSELPVFTIKKGLLKFHPLIDFSHENLSDYFEINDLPEHPLKAKGYASIGCSHCTLSGEGRGGRWTGKDKSECGLHTD